MLKQIVLCAPLLAFVTGAQALDNVPANPAFSRQSAAPAAPAEALLTQISHWLTVNFGLKAAAELPKIEVVTPARMAAVRFRGLASDRSPNAAAEAGRSAPPDFGLDVYALYDDARRVIYLHQNWTGASPADVSVLVHEMVHHLQNTAGEKFACPQEREKDAYRAQRQWLEQFGRTLEDDFEIDPLSILVRTTCMF